MPKRLHACAHCGETFTNITDHMLHVTGEHDPRTTPRLRRDVSCWRCARPVPATTLTCGCGWIHPTKEVTR